MTRLSILLLSGLALSMVAFALKSDDKVDFNRDIRPILNQKCLSCHGGVKMNGKLSLRFMEDARNGGESGKPAIVPGKPNQSELIRRISHPDPEFRMPAEGEPLTESEIMLFKKWVRQGANWDTHWAYINPNADIQPPSARTKWGFNVIDRFIYQKLKTHDLQPSPEADRPTLLRRVSLDITGLPPGKEEIHNLIQEASPGWYEEWVDHLLDSPHFGEKWASMWLDLARYADSQGYQKDLLRPDMWRYRDWVIYALNNDMPFDQFTIEQLAGDLLPDPTDDQLLATAFHRNTMTNDEGGTDDEEFRVAAVLDRVNTTFEIWQGATVGCVQCHSHPYDPFQHEEYYQLYSFFNTTSDRDLTNEKPVLSLLSPHQKKIKQDLTFSLERFALEGDTLSDRYRGIMKEYLEIKAGDIPVMKELPADSSRKTFVFERGNWLMHGREVLPSTPAFLPTLESSERLNRLDLAKWIVSPENPLTARVIVNRIWEQIFGIGIVETLEDFGTQGSPPSHPDLLDWLAIKFQTEYQWSLKKLIREIALSATYRQSAGSSDELNRLDPYNRLLARGPRVRLSAEQIRDQALSVSGLLNTKIYGPSVMPYQPEGVWNVIRHASKWTLSEHEDRYRRGLYTFWRRVSPYPSMELFDSPSRELCTSRRIRTNTPLQALVTLNDPAYTEAAESLALRMAEEGGSSIQEKIRFGYFTLLMKDIGEARMKELELLYTGTLELLQDRWDQSGQFQEIDREKAEIAGLTQVASVLLNLDEVIMKS